MSNDAFNASNITFQRRMEDAKGRGKYTTVPSPPIFLGPLLVPPVSMPGPGADCVKAYFPPGAAMAAMEAAHPPSRTVHTERSDLVEATVGVGVGVGGVVGGFFCRIK